MHFYDVGVKVTPEMAKEFISQGITIQRTMKQNKISEFTRMMLDGKWRYPNGQVLIFNKDGIMCDGQNRCQAIINSNKSIKFDICRGIPVENCDSIDNCTARTHADLLTIKYKENGIDHKYAKYAAGAMRTIVSWERGNIYQCGAGINALDVYAAEHRHRDIVTSVKLLNKKGLLANKSVCIALHYLISRNESKKIGITNFFTSFLDGLNLERGNPVHTLREKCINVRNHNEAQRPHQQMAWILRCWYHYLEGKKLFIIKVKNPPQLVI